MNLGCERACRADRERGKVSPLGAVLVLLELLLDHADHDLVADQSTGVHDLLGGFSELSLSSDLRSEHVSGSEVAHAVLVGDVRSLGSFS